MFRNRPLYLLVFSQSFNVCHVVQCRFLQMTQEIVYVWMCYLNSPLEKKHENFRRRYWCKNRICENVPGRCLFFLSNVSFTFTFTKLH